MERSFSTKSPRLSGMFDMMSIVELPCLYRSTPRVFLTEAFYTKYDSY